MVQWIEKLGIRVRFGLAVEGNCATENGQNFVRADKTLYKKKSNNPECPFFQFLPKEKKTSYNLTSVSVPGILTDRFKNVFSNRIIFKYDM